MYSKSTSLRFMFAKTAASIISFTVSSLASNAFQNHDIVFNLHGIHANRVRAAGALVCERGSRCHLELPLMPRTAKNFSFAEPYDLPRLLAGLGHPADLAHAQRTTAM